MILVLGVWKVKWIGNGFEGGQIYDGLQRQGWMNMAAMTRIYLSGKEQEICVATRPWSIDALQRKALGYASIRYNIHLRSFTVARRTTAVNPRTARKITPDFTTFRLLATGFVQHVDISSLGKK